VSLANQLFYLELKMAETYREQRSKHPRFARTNKGVLLAEGAVALVIVIFGLIISVALVLNACIGATFKNRLVVVSNLAAQFAVARSSDAGLEAETDQFVQQLLPQVGLTPCNLVVTAKRETIDNQPGVLVSISNQFSVIGNGTMMPMKLLVADTEFGAIKIPDPDQ
jgi:hypothetical protein